MKKIITLSVGSLSVLVCLCLWLFLNGFSSFDRFARETIRNLGHRSSDHLVTQAFKDLILSKDIEDQFSYFGANFDHKVVLERSNPNLSSTDRAWLGDDTEKLTTFYNYYFRTPITEYEFRIFIRDLLGGNRTLHARINYLSP